MRALFVAIVMLVAGLGSAYGAEPNAAPVAADDMAAVTAGGSVRIEVLANDTDDGPLAVVGTTGDARVSFTADAVTFVAGSADSGTYSFGYTVSDGELTASATVTVTIQALGRSLRLAAPRALHALRPVAISAAATPASAVRLTLQRRAGSGPWRTVKLVTSGPDGLGTFTLTPVRRERWRLRGVARWPDGSTARSAVLDRQVRVSADLQVSGPLTERDVPWSYRAGCPVGPAQLRRLRVTHVDYQDRVRRGTLVVAASAVRPISKVLTRALRDGFPIRRIEPADAFYSGGRRTPTQSDIAAMHADNTSAFNCRTVTGNPYRLSQHSYGNAVDINTARNPYVLGRTVYPSYARSYLNRRNVRPGMILHGGVVARTFRNLGWLWGGRWQHPDYQHFSANGG